MARTKFDTDYIIAKVLNVINKFSIGGTQVTATAAELNILDGVTATTAELNKLDGVDRTTAQINLLLQGYAAGYKLARGSQSATATVDVDTGLATIVGFALTPRADTATKMNNGAAVSGSVSGATLTLKRWKHTSTSNPTYVAATAAGTVDWLAVGT